MRANETARASGATRCVGTDEVGMWASPMLGPRVNVYEVCAGELGEPDVPGEPTLGLAAT